MSDDTFAARRAELIAAINAVRIIVTVPGDGGYLADVNSTLGAEHPGAAEAILRIIETTETGRAYLMAAL